MEAQAFFLHRDHDLKMIAGIRPLAKEFFNYDFPHSHEQA